MTLARLNGWRVSAAVKSPPTKKLTHHGELSSRFDGRPVRHRKSIERSFVLTTTKMEETCADTLEGLLEGRNHHFAFVHDVWSESGIGPQIGNTWTLIDSGGPVATRGHYVDVGAGGLTYNPKFVDDPAAPGGGRWGVIYSFLNGTTWERRMLRSDGSKFVNGVSSLALFPELIVSVGAVAFLSGAEIADLSLLSFFPCDEFAPQEYEWVTGQNMAWRMRFDNDFVDDVAGHVGVPAGTMVFGKSPLGQAVTLDGATQEIVMPDAAYSDFDGQGAVTLQAWVRRGVAVSAIEHIIDGRVGASTDVKLAMWMGNDDTVVVRASSQAGDEQGLGTTAISQNVWHLLTFVVDLAADSMVVYDGDTVIGSNLAVGFAATTFSGGVTTGGVKIGRDSLTTQRWSGDIDEVRLFHRALTPAQIAEIDECESERISWPGPRFSSSFPRLDLWGDIVGCRNPVEVLGEVTGETYVQHGGEAGWVNNDREMIIKLDAVKGNPDKDRIPTPDVGWVFNPKMLANPGTSGEMPAPMAGRYTLLGTGFTYDNRGKPGPFGYPARAFTFNGDYADANAADAAEFLHGAQSVTILAWAKTPSPTTSQVLFEMWLNNTPDIRLRLDTLASRIRLSARSEAADALENTAGTPAILANEWLLMGGTVDLLADEIVTYFDGVQNDIATAVGFGQTRFSAEAKTVSPYLRIGANAAAGAPWLGDIAGIYIWRRKLTPGEIFSVNELGKRGVFS